MFQIFQIEPSVFNYMKMVSYSYICIENNFSLHPGSQVFFQTISLVNIRNRLSRLLLIDCGDAIVVDSLFDVAPMVCGGSMWGRGFAM